MSADPNPMPELAVDEEPFDLDTLDAYIAAADDDKAPGDPLGPTSIDFGLAEWMMRHVMSIDLNMAEIDQQYRDQRDRIDRWHAAARSRLIGRRDYFVDRLELYAAENRARDERNNKTTRLPSGEITSVEHKPAPKIIDPDAVVEWAKGIAPEPGTLWKSETIEKPVAAEIKKAVRVETVVTHVRYTATLADGSTVDLGTYDAFVAGITEPPVSVGDMLDVSDGISDRPEAVAAIDAENITALAVVYDDGEDRNAFVPGMIVTPRSIDFTVRPAT